VIEGVRVRALERHADDRGSLTELLRSDWPEFTRFGQAIVTGMTARPM
jgi:dTDP-4-dehydrorhamnose 3,5-epimerase